MTRAIVFAPKSAHRGDVIEIRAAIQHPMETGYRWDGRGGLVGRDIVSRFECRYGGELVFAADFWPAIAANPMVSFFTVATTSATLEFSWTGDHGFAHTETVALAVE